MITILGAGISGISAAYHLQKNGIRSTVYEKNNTWGGLCDNFTIGNGFRFDHFIHLSFTKSKYVQTLFADSSKYISHKPDSTNYYHGTWLKHPAQNNLAPLSAEEKTKIILDFIDKPDIEAPRNYDEWLCAKFGSYFKDHFPAQYSKKYWTLPPEMITTDWLGNRFSIPSTEEVLRGAFEEQSKNFYYADEMRYPVKGGYKSFLKGMASRCDIQINKKVVMIDPSANRIEFADGSFEHYDHLISSLPLPELIKSIKDVPGKVTGSADKLTATSGQLLSIGFNRPDIPKDIWFYIYDNDFLPSRAYSPSIKSADNVPAGKSSLQFETYFSKYLPKKLSGTDLTEHIVKKGSKMGLWSANDIDITDYREARYANILFDFDRKKSLETVNNYLDALGIACIGRFGKWDYLWSDQSLLSGKQAAEVFIDSDVHK